MQNTEYERNLKAKKKKELEETRREGIQNEHGNVFYLQACIFDIIHNVTYICMYIYI